MAEQREVEESERQDGLTRYRVALDIADAGLCPESTAGEAATRLEAARDRLRAKLGAESSDDGEELEAPQEQEQSRQAGEESDAQQEQLSERNQTGAAEHEDQSDWTPARPKTKGRPTGEAPQSTASASVVRRG